MKIRIEQRGGKLYGYILLAFLKEKLIAVADNGDDMEDYLKPFRRRFGEDIEINHEY